jgi:peptidyl-tRNA hydrolase, PTH1 family
VTWLVAGLGNPGERYARTRHNVGRMVVDLLCARAGARLRKVRFLPVEAAEIHHPEDPSQRLLLAASTRFMNESGPGYAGLAGKQGIEPGQIIAAHDEIDFPFGALRIKFGGSTAGHRGLDSLVQALRTPEFFRVRIGVGRGTGRQDPADFVLEPFAKREQPEVEVLLEDAADAVLSLVTHGLSATQERFNRPGPPR